MSLKLKLISLISVFMLVLGMLITGVFAASQGTVNMGGSLSFVATDVYARIEGRVTGAVGENPLVLPTLNYSASTEPSEEELYDWSNLNLTFDEDAAAIEIVVTNLASDRTLTVNIEDTISVDSTTNLRKTITKDGGAYSSGTNSTLEASTATPSNTTTYKITFEVKDPNNSLPEINFNYIIHLLYG